MLCARVFERILGVMLKNLFLIFAALSIFFAPCFAYAEDSEKEDDDDETEVYVDPRSVRVRVAFLTAVNSRFNLPGDIVKAKLVEDLKFNDDVIAPKGSRIRGRVELVSKKKLNKHRYLTVRFDQITKPDKTKFPIIASASPQHTIFSNGHIVREIKVGPDGEFQKTGTAELYVLEDLKIEIPMSYLKLKDRLEVDIQPGDQIVVSADVTTLTSVDAKIVKP